MTRPQIIEVMARAMCTDPDKMVEVGYWVIAGRGSSLPDGAAHRYHEGRLVLMWETKIPEATRQLTALESTGYIVRPREATEGMLDAGGYWIDPTDNYGCQQADRADRAMTEAWLKEMNGD